MYICSVISSLNYLSMSKLELKQNDPWWVILLKVIAYAIGLIIGGIGTVNAAVMLAMA